MNSSLYGACCLGKTCMRLQSGMSLMVGLGLHYMLPLVACSICIQEAPQHGVSSSVDGEARLRQIEYGQA